MAKPVIFKLTEREADLLEQVVSQAATDCAEPKRGKRLDDLQSKLSRQRLSPAPDPKKPA